MRFITTILTLASALTFTSAAPAPGEPSIVRGNLFERQALCVVIANRTASVVALLKR
ncbi:hypothetical protein A1F96_02469 [Pyrenophora tritici-repentis]|nr:hypothetical protein A1F96_02469 [Pyrenophora tritici-repentis]